MHDGCSGKFDDGMQVEEITMTTFEYECPHCSMVYAVTPCHAFDVENILTAGKAKK